MLKIISDGRIEAVEEPCLKNEDCPFGVADLPVPMEDENSECTLCHERTVAQAQLKDDARAILANETKSGGDMLGNKIHYFYATEEEYQQLKEIAGEA